MRKAYVSSNLHGVLRDIHVLRNLKMIHSDQKCRVASTNCADSCLASWKKCPWMPWCQMTNLPLHSLGRASNVKATSREMPDLPDLPRAVCECDRFLVKPVIKDGSAKLPNLYPRVIQHATEKSSICVDTFPIKCQMSLPPCHHAQRISHGFPS